jgi:glycine/D-amino acid oxidase-like deaminating enzyme
VRDWPDRAEEPAVLACGTAAQGFEGGEYLELAAVHGQLDLAVPSDPSGSSADGSWHLENLRTPLVGPGYVARLPDTGSETGAALFAAGLYPEGLYAIGATYEYSPWPETQASDRNHSHLQHLGATGFKGLQAEKGIRAVSSDRLPILGPLFDRDGGFDPNRLVTTGHGSMGTVTAHLGASMVLAWVTGSFPPLADAQAALVSPQRFRLRQARRGYRLGATS